MRANDTMGDYTICSATLAKKTVFQILKTKFYVTKTDNNLKQKASYTA